MKEEILAFIDYNYEIVSVLNLDEDIDCQVVIKVDDNIVQKREEKLLKKELRNFCASNLYRAKSISLEVNKICGVSTRCDR